MSALQECRDALGSDNMRAFLRVIRAGETGQRDEAYRTMFGGSLFDSFDDHPRRLHSVGRLSSTAAGAYQFLARTWDECRAALSLPDFSPAMQDMAAVYLIRRRGALADVLAGRIEQAIAGCAREWASLPGSPYGQPTRTLAQALAVYAQFGGRLATDAPPAPEEAPAAPIPPVPAPSAPKGKTVPPFLLAALPSLLELIPKLGKVFAGDSPTAQRNVAAATIVADVVQQATGAKNIQEAVETIRADPVALQAATQAVTDRWLDITEAGSGGIDGAGKRDAAARAAGDMRSSPSFWIACLLLPLVYLLVLSLIGMVGTATWSDDVRAGLAGSLISAVIGGLVGYYYGQTTSRNRSTTP